MTESTYLPHMTRDGERWDQLAFRYYGDVAMQDSLIATNRGLFLDALTVPPVLPAGLTLRIPIIEREAIVAADQLPPWKR